MQNTATPYDDVFRTLLNDCTGLVLPLINEAFHENYDGTEEILFYPNEHFLNGQDGQEAERVTDSCFVIQRNVRKKYHVECQSSPDDSMLIRMFEYDSQIALDDSEVAGGVLRVRFPQSAVLFLRYNKNTPDKMQIVIETSGGEVSYEIPVIKMQKYTLEEILKKKLFMLVPFYIFTYEKELKRINADEERLKKLELEYQNIRESLEEMSASGIMSEYTKCTIVDMTGKVVEHLAKNYAKVKEGVKTVMGGKVLEYEAKTILRQGIREGIQEGIQQGMRQGLDEKGIRVFQNLLDRGYSVEDAQSIAEIDDRLVEIALENMQFSR